MAKRILLGAVLVSVLALAACGGGGGGGDIFPPVVLSADVTPAPGATVSRYGLKAAVPFNEELACWDGEQPFADKESGATGTIACQGSTVRVSFDNEPLYRKTSLTARLSGVSDKAGNVMAPYSWTYQLQVDAATVVLSATPDTIVVGEATTLTWVTTHADHCLATGGWTGDRAKAGGTEEVSPTVTTTYSIECWGQTGNSSGVETVTVTVKPKPSVVHPATVVMFGPNWVYRVDPTAPDGIVPIANNSGRNFYSYGFRAVVLPNCQIQVSALESAIYTELWVLYNRQKAEFTLDTSGTAPPRLVGNYIFAVLPDPSWPGTVMNLIVGDERYYVLNGEYQSLWYQKGTAPAVKLGTYTLGIKAIIAYPACTEQ